MTSKKRMIFRRIGIFAAAFALGGALAGAQEGAAAFFQGLSKDELAALDRGEVLVRGADGSGKLALAASGAYPDRFRSRIASLEPNYLTQVMAVVEGGSEGIESLRRSLSDVAGYTKIIYHSPRYDADFPLFDKMVLKSRQSAPGGEAVETTQHMLPFEEFGSAYEYEASADELYFESSNTTSLRYSGFEAVKKGDMAWCLYAKASGGRVYYYGAGAMRVFDFFGAARGRLEPSFTGRVEAFMRFMSGKIKGAP
jgi:hypothetical protein